MDILHRPTSPRHDVSCLVKLTLARSLLSTRLVVTSVYRSYRQIVIVKSRRPAPDCSALPITCGLDA
ncbi:hypothetical protein J6590_004411 [Homalodisca vitripennis]|nr:hypothetical protein J6590_004411 [Homalodisca vitripennis]